MTLKKQNSNNKSRYKILLPFSSSSKTESYWSILDFRNCFPQNSSMIDSSSLHEMHWYEEDMQIQVGRDTGKAFIFASTNPHYDGRLFIELRVQYMKIPISEHVVYIVGQKQFVYTTISELEIFMYWTRNSMNTLWSYFGFVDKRFWQRFTCKIRQ